MVKYTNGYNYSLHITKKEFEVAVNKVKSVKELCEILKKSKPSVYTYACRFGVNLKQRYSSGIRKQDGYYHYDNPKNHRVIMASFLKRKLLRNEHVHHIDGNKTNNELNNLIVLDWSQHKKTHNSLEKIAFSLFQSGKIIFDKKNKIYKLKKVKG